MSWRYPLHGLARDRFAERCHDQNVNRIMMAAAKAELGDWRRSDRMNTDTEGGLVVGGSACLAVTLLVLLMGELNSIGAYIGSAVLTLAGVVFLVIGLSHHGRWMVHSFDQGIVMERTRGRVISARYDDLHAELRSYRTPGDAETPPIDHVLLRLGFPVDGSYVMAAPVHGDAEVLVQLAEHCGAGPAQPIEYPAPEELLSTHPWR
jgi:hypothetical protein